MYYTQHIFKIVLAARTNNSFWLTFPFALPTLVISLICHHALACTTCTPSWTAGMHQCQEDTLPAKLVNVWKPQESRGLLLPALGDFIMF
jgi:hypothetical protein